MSTNQTIILKHSTVKDKLPSSAQYGEVFVNYNQENPFLATINNQGQFEKFLSENKLNELYYNKSQVNDIVANLESGGTIDFDDYYKKNEVDTLLQGKSDTGHTHSYTALTDLPDLSIYLTEHQDISYLATKQELESYQSISGMSSYLTVSQAEQDFQPKGDYVAPSDLDDYLTIASASTIYATKGEIPDTSGFATKQELEDYQMKSGMTSYLTIAQAEQDLQPKGDYALQSQIPDTSNFITSGFCEDHYQPKGTYVVPSDLNDYALKSELPSIEGLATEAELANYQPVSGMSDYVTDSELNTALEGYSTTAHTHSEYAEKTDLANYMPNSGMTDYALKSEIPSLDGLATEAELANYQPQSAMTEYVTDSELNTALEGKSNTGHTHSYNDLTDKPTIPTTDGLATKQELANYQPVSGMSDYVTDSELNTALEGYSTTAHTHSEYAEKTDLANYMPNSGMTDYALKSEIPNSYTKTEADNLLAGKANSAHTHTVSDITDLNIPSVEGLASEAWVSQNYQPQSGMSAYSTTAHTHSDLATKAELDDYLTIASASTIYATKEELEEFTPSGDNYAGTVWTGTLSEYNNLTVIDTDTLYVITDANLQYVTSGQVESMTSGYTNLTEVQTLLEGYSQTGHTHSYNDLTDKPIIPSTTGLASETWVSQNFQPQSAMTEYSLSGHTHSQYLTETSADTRYARVVALTQAQYDALAQNDQVEQGVLYCIIEQSNS